MKEESVTTDKAKKFKIAATGKVPIGAFVNLSAAGVGNRGKVKDPDTGKMVDGTVYVGRIEAGQELEVDVIDFPERLRDAVERGDLTVVSGAK